MAQRDEQNLGRESTSDRRSGARILVDLPVTVFSEGFRHDCRTVDLSSSGMVVEVTKSLSAREPHLVYAYELELPGRGTIHVTGRTAWRRARLQGVRFVVVADDDKSLLGDFLHQVRRQRASDLERLELAEHLDRLHGVKRSSAA